MYSGMDLRIGNPTHVSNPGRALRRQKKGKYDLVGRSNLPYNPAISANHTHSLKLGFVSSFVPDPSRFLGIPE
jgi:hypothetical protein